MSTKLFVRNLSWSVTEADLRNTFAQAGTVVSVKIPTRREDGKPRGFAFVEMMTSDAAQNAVNQCNGAVLHERDIVVAFQDESRENSGPRSNGGGFQNTKSNKLFVRQVSSNVSEQDLETLFSGVGQVVSAKIPLDRDTGYSKGFAFIEMSSVEEAEQAIAQLNNTFLSGKEIQIDFQNPDRQKSKPKSYGQSGGRSYNQSGYNLRW